MLFCYFSPPQVVSKSPRFFFFAKTCDGVNIASMLLDLFSFHQNSTAARGCCYETAAVFLAPKPLALRKLVVFSSRERSAWNTRSRFRRIHCTLACVRPRRHRWGPSERKTLATNFQEKRFSHSVTNDPLKPRSTDELRSIKCLWKRTGRR